MDFQFHHLARAALIAGSCVAFGAPLAFAQTTGSTPDKAAPKPAASTKPAAPATKAPAKTGAPAAADRAKEGRTASGEKLMTRDELRVCLGRSDELVARRQQLEKEDAALVDERKVLDGSADELRRAHEMIRTDSEQKQAAFKARADELTARVNAFRARTAGDPEASSRMQSRSQLEAKERERLQMEKERVQLDEDIKTLNADRDVLIRELEQRTQAHNLRVTERDQKIAAFTERHRLYKASVEKHEDEAGVWRRECGDRPYREDDERAIRAGK